MTSETVIFKESNFRTGLYSSISTIYRVISPVRKLDFLKFTVSDVTNLNFQGYPCDISHRHFYRFGGFFFQVGRENRKWRKENYDESDTKPVLFLVFLSFRIIFGAFIRSVQMNIGKNPIWLNILKNLAES